MEKRIVLLFALIMSAASCGTKELRVQEFRVAAGTPDPGKPPDEFYVIGAGDVKCQRLEGAQLGYKGRPDGFVTVPLVTIQAGRPRRLAG
jgi:hypothetical protein